LKAGLARRRAECGACQDVIGLQGGTLLKAVHRPVKRRYGNRQAKMQSDAAAAGEGPAMPASFAPRRVAVDLHGRAALAAPVRPPGADAPAA